MASFLLRVIKTSRAKRVRCSKISLDQLPATKTKDELNRPKISIIEVEVAASFSNKIRTVYQTRPVDSCKIMLILTTRLRSNKFWNSRWRRDSTPSNLRFLNQVANRILSDIVKNSRLNTNKSTNSRCKSIRLQTESWTRIILEPNTSLRSWMLNKADINSSNLWISRSKCFKTIISRLFAVFPTVAIVITTTSSSSTLYRAKTCKWCRTWVRWHISRWLVCKIISTPGRGELTTGKRPRVSICSIRRAFLIIWTLPIC